MKIISTTVGSYPRPKWFREYLRKVEGLQKDIYGKIDENVLEKAIREVIEEQKRAGIDLLTDGQLIWHDFLAHLATKLDGFKMGKLVRYFDNNLYYRVPIVCGKIKRIGKILNDFEIAFKIDKNLKPVISCFTLAKLSKNEYYDNFDDFVMDIAEAMREEVKELKTEWLQIDEPSLLYATKDEIEIAKNAINLISTKEKKTILMTYFDPADKLLPYLLDFNIDIIGLDFVEGFEENLRAIKEYCPEKICIGIVDGRNTKMESINELKEKTIKILDSCQFKEVLLSPNTGLEFLPWQKAFDKMKIVVKLKEAIKEVV